MSRCLSWAESVMRLVALRTISDTARISSSVTASGARHPSSVGNLSFSIWSCQNICSRCVSVHHLPKKYFTRSLSTVPVSTSPNAMIGAATSPILKSSISDVNLYVGLNALDSICRASLLLASISAVRVSAVQYALDRSKTVWLKTWLFPKKSSERLVPGQSSRRSISAG